MMKSQNQYIIDVAVQNIVQRIGLRHIWRQYGPHGSEPECPSKIEPRASQLSVVLLVHNIPATDLLIYQKLSDKR